MRPQPLRNGSCCHPVKSCFHIFALLICFILLPVIPSLECYDLEEKVVEHTLANGLKIIILPRRDAPVVSLYMRFLAGSVDEPQGRSGMAHLLEHMLFKGTERLGTTNYREEKALLLRLDELHRRLDRFKKEREAITDGPDLDVQIERLEEQVRALQAEHKKYVIKDEIDKIYTRNGARNFNASTSVDMTTYHIDLPANRLELWAVIESDRMRNPVLREFYSEREVVKEERRQSYDSQPNRLLTELFMATAYMAHPYGRPIIGWMSDIQYLPRSETDAFFRKYYSPGNTILAVVGDVDPDEVISLMEKYFGPIPPAAEPPGVNTREPAQKGERRAYLKEEANPMLIIGYHKPTLPHRDDYVFDLIDGLLSNGRTSRLYRRLVEEEKVAASVHTINGFPGARYDNLFAFIAVPLSPASPEKVEELIYDELERLKKEPASAEELEKIKRSMKADFIRGLKSNSGLASMLSYFEALAGDWRYITRHTDIIDSISPQELIEVAGRYFNEENRTVAVLERADQ